MVSWFYRLYVRKKWPNNENISGFLSLKSLAMNSLTIIIFVIVNWTFRRVGLSKCPKNGPHGFWITHTNVYAKFHFSVPFSWYSIYWWPLSRLKWYKGLNSFGSKREVMSKKVVFFNFNHLHGTKMDNKPTLFWLTVAF